MRKYKITYVAHIILPLNSKCCSRTGAGQHGPVFVKKALLAHSHTICVVIMYGYFPAVRTRLSSCDRHHVAAKPKIYTILPFTTPAL